jgi:hypothetical protein
MPTSLTLTYSSAVVAPVKSSHALDAIRPVDLGCGHVAVRGHYRRWPGAAARDPFPHLATF